MTTVRENTMAFSLVTVAQDFSNDQYAVIETMCANPSPRDFVSLTKRTGTNAERVVYASALMLV